ncbi:MAG TPA: FimV/HubP family polar landmark protein [Casimicrobiaceae bacterium]|nr:FimV/HubP family polar landmark protein [Casimicrobiaceae bacterium]
MKPIFKYSLVAGAMALPAAAYALGLGRLTVESYVGQPLVARIELLTTSKEELDTLSARVADQTLYKQNSLQYQAVLSRSRVTVERGANDTAYLRVTSSTPVTEPYLDLLVEANWAAGRVVRDYTFLLDPPGSQQTSVEPVTPVRPGMAAAPRAQPPAPASAAPAPAPAPVARGEGETYEVKRGDTLSKVANQYKPETVTLDQMLVALFKSNADAFEGSNMNRLRTGAIITIPSAADASAASPREATKTVQVQASDWRAYRDRVAGAAPSAEEGTSRAAEGRIGTAVQERTPAARAGSDQLRVSKEAGTGKGSLAETNASQAAALREAQSRITELEKTIKDMQRAMELRNSTMAQLADKGKAPTPAVTAPITTPPPVTPEPKAATETPKAPVEAPKAATETPKAPVEAPKAATETPKAPAETPKAATETPKAPAETPKAATETPKAPTETPKAAVEAPKTPPPKAVVKAPAKEPPGFFEELLNNTPIWAFLVGALALIAGLVAIFAARRRKTTKFEDSIISGTDIKTNTVFGSTGGGVVNTGDNSLASDFSREGLGNIDTDEVDPIAEAEVYLAYGRDAQAEEILKDALKKDPQRQEIYLKLLEIHAQHNKPSAFETVASELYAVTNGQGDVWQKAVALGRQLDPANPMFAEGGAPAPRAAAAEPMRDAPVAAPSDTGLEFQMDEEISISPTSGVAPKTPADILAGAESELEKTARLSSTDFDPDRTMALPAAGAAIAGAVAAKEATEAAARSTLHDKVEPVLAKAPEAADKFDLDFKLDEVEKPAPMGKPRSEPVLETAGAPVSPGAAPAQLARPAAALELDKLDLSFDPERSTFEDPTPSVLDGQWHDAATKLDLAKAYQEMGDVEGAREILQEVLHEGDDQQKAEAKSLLAKLG